MRCKAVGQDIVGLGNTKTVDVKWFILILKSSFRTRDCWCTKCTNSTTNGRSKPIPISTWKDHQLKYPVLSGPPITGIATAELLVRNTLGGCTKAQQRLHGSIIKEFYNGKGKVPSLHATDKLAKKIVPEMRSTMIQLQ